MRSTTELAAILLVAWPLAAAAPAGADEAAEGVRLSGGLRVDARYEDHGLEREPAYSPTKTAAFELALRLGVEVAATRRTTFEAVADSRTAGFLQAAVVRHEVSDTLAFRAGRDYVNAGGWDQKDRGVTALAPSLYVQRHMPWTVAKGTAPALGPATAAAVSVVVTFAKVGIATLQVLDDVVVGEDAAARFSHNRRQPAALFEWRGSGTTLAPLFQAGTYDLNHSAFAAAGLRLTLGALEVRGDLLIDVRGQPTSSHQRVATQYRSASIDAAYDLGEAQVFGKFAALEVVQPGNDGGKDHAANQPDVVFDDDGRTLALGARYRLDGDAFAPFVAVIVGAGRFLTDAADPGGPMKTKREVALALGVTSHF